MSEISKHNQQAIDNYLTELSSNRKDAGTIKHVNYTLSRLAKFLGDTDFEKATKEQMMKYFDTIKSDSTYNIAGSQIKRFLGWLNTPEDKRDEKIETTNNMKWFKYLNEKKRSQKKDPEGIKKYLITPEEYKTILEVSKDKYGFYEALWETYRFSGGRLGEVQSMTVGDVKIEDNHVTLVLPDSKTIAREVPIKETPHLLLRWLGNHPNRNNLKAPLWCHMFNQNKINESISTITIENVFWKIRENTNIKKTLSIHCFRKTRATELFNQRSTDGGLIYSDTHMAKLFGWTPETVAQRRREYDLTTQDDLKKLIFNTKGMQVETYDIIKSEKEELETTYQQKLNKQQKELDDLKKLMESLWSALGNDKTEAYQLYKTEQAEFEDSVNKVIGKTSN